ncbi:hypothetical protein J1C67_05770 [Clostridium gasigenes]|uniref:hypothetical protein n=1 Tax=Clostridium gasigenes TaxID=94869 RepID=UPI0014385F83|nr:hypothetical protein [Clostridium gasigenes]NKF07954.1 hypothetical protein [Clostridium gasigenes]QSW20669.1 hypothetical protein J1C67_05770 [Clostridium gasigenes]
MDQIKQIQVELKKEDDSILTPWQIQDFISTLASNYYKLDLINEISKQINNGVSEENIFIINESFNYNNKYVFLNRSNRLNLNDIEDFKHFFHFGNPISLIPNEDMNTMSLKFSIFRDLNNYLYSKGESRIDKAKFQVVAIQKNSSFEDIIKLVKFKKETSKDIKERMNTDIKDIENKYVKLVKERNSHEIQINTFKTCIENNKLDDNEEYIDIKEKYFNEFEKCFTRLERPIVGIYNVDKRVVEILSSSFIMKDSRDERFLDIKEISHNSPTYVNLFVGIAFATPLLILFANIITEKIKGNDEIEDIKYSAVEESIRFVHEEHEDEALMSKVEACEKLDDEIEVLLNELVKKEELKGYEKIEKTYSKNLMYSMSNNIESKTVENIKEYGFQNKELSAKIIDFKDIKKKRNTVKIEKINNKEMKK